MVEHLVFTDEVNAIVRADRAAGAGHAIVVAALPGTGKTTLLQHLVRTNGVPNTCYVMFNRKPCDEFRAFLERAGVATAMATTFHKLAYDAVRECGVPFAGGFTDEPPEDVQALADDARCDVADLLMRDPQLSRDWFDRARAGDWSVTSDVVLHWMSHADVMPELRETATVKRFLAASKLYVDEAQDCKRSMVRIVRMALERGASALVAGDSNQFINGFMGACDPVGGAAAHFPGGARMPLSVSWRFGQDIADAFNRVTSAACRGRAADTPAPAAAAAHRRRDVVVLVRTNKCADATLDLLRANGIRATKRTRDSDPPEEGVEVSTVHQAKGGGWHTCVVTDDVLLPRPPRAREASRRYAQNLVATAVSRAREALFVSERIADAFGIKENEHVKRFRDPLDIARLVAEAVRAPPDAPAPEAVPDPRADANPGAQPVAGAQAAPATQPQAEAARPAVRRRTTITDYFARAT